MHIFDNISSIYTMHVNPNNAATFTNKIEPAGTELSVAVNQPG